MGRSELDSRFNDIGKFYSEIDKHVPENSSNGLFRSHLAGLLSVYIVAQYEGCVRDTFLAFAGARNERNFCNYIEKQYEKLNSKIKPAKLSEYCKFFSNSAVAFEAELKKLGNEKAQYTSLLKSRNSFAHAANIPATTTPLEIISQHNEAKKIIEAFYDCLLGI